MYCLVACYLMACTTLGPDYQRPAVDLSEQWLNKNAGLDETQNSDHRDWWTTFDDPVLNKLVEYAYQQNYPLQMAGVQILEAKAQLQVALGQRYPQQQQLRAAATYHSLSESRANTFKNSFISQDFNYWDYDIGIAASWELDLWGKFGRAIQSANATLLAQLAHYDEYLISLIAQVADSYIAIRTFEARLALANKNVEIQQKSLRITRARFDNGATSELDVQQARALLNNTRATIPTIETGLHQAKNALSVLLAIRPANLDALLGAATGNIPQAQSSIIVGVPAELLRRRPDIKHAEYMAAAQSARIGVAKAELYPSFSLFGSLGFVASDGASLTSTGKDGTGQLLQSQSVEFVGGPGLRWNLFNYGRLKNLVRVQDARFQQRLLNYQQTVLRAAREVEDAMTGYIRSKNELQYLHESVNAAERAVTLALLQYRDGVSDYTRVLDTQTFLVTQQDRLTATSGIVASYAVAVYRALGGGWQIREHQHYVSEEIIKQMRERTDWNGTLTQ